MRISLFLTFPVDCCAEESHLVSTHNSSEDVPLLLQSSAAAGGCGVTKYMQIYFPEGANTNNLGHHNVLNGPTRKGDFLLPWMPPRLNVL